MLGQHLEEGPTMWREIADGNSSNEMYIEGGSGQEPWSDELRQQAVPLSNVSGSIGKTSVTVLILTSFVLAWLLKCVVVASRCMRRADVHIESLSPHIFQAPVTPQYQGKRFQNEHVPGNGSPHLSRHFGTIEIPVGNNRPSPAKTEDIHVSHEQLLKADPHYLTHFSSYTTAASQPQRTNLQPAEADEFALESSLTRADGMHRSQSHSVHSSYSPSSIGQIEANQQIPEESVSEKRPSSADTTDDVAPGVAPSNAENPDLGPSLKEEIKPSDSADIIWKHSLGSSKATASAETSASLEDPASPKLQRPIQHLKLIDTGGGESSKSNSARLEGIQAEFSSEENAHVLAERRRVLVIEERLMDILSDTEKTLNGVSIKYESARDLKELYLELNEQFRGHSLTLMNSGAVARVTWEAAALKVAALYATVKQPLRLSLQQLHRTLKKAFGDSKKRLMSVAAAHVGVPYSPPLQGHFLNDSPFCDEEKRRIFVREDKLYKQIDQENTARFAKMMAPMKKALKHVEFRSLVYTCISALSNRAERFVHFSKAAVEFLREAEYAFGWDDVFTKNACRALSDVITLSSKLALDAVSVWTEIAKGNLPMSTKERIAFQDAVITANIAFDHLIITSTDQRLPRAVVDVFYPYYPFPPSRKEKATSLQQNFIKWGSMLMAQLRKEGHAAKPVSVEDFQFRGMLNRPFSETWLLRDYRERLFIAKTNQAIVSEDSKYRYDFVRALTLMQRRGRYSTDMLHSGWWELSSGTEKRANSEDQWRDEIERAGHRLREQTWMQKYNAEVKKKFEILECERNRQITEFKEHDLKRQEDRKAGALADLRNVQENMICWSLQELQH